MEKTIRTDPRFDGEDEEKEAGLDAPVIHNECLEECRRTCKRNFWTEVLRTVTKVAGLALAAFGLSSFEADD